MRYKCKHCYMYTCMYIFKHKKFFLVVDQKDHVTLIVNRI